MDEKRFLQGKRLCFHFNSGTRLNYDMLMSIMPELKSRYDFIFIPVMHRLKTHAYWQRWGATEFYRDAESVYYKLTWAKI